MAKKSLIARNNKRIALNKKFSDKRAALKKIIMDKSPDIEIIDRIRASAKLASLPRNSAKTRITNRCFITGRVRGYYGYFGLSRIMLREMALFGLLPGVRKRSL